MKTPIWIIIVDSHNSDLSTEVFGIRAEFLNRLKEMIEEALTDATVDEQNGPEGIAIRNFLAAGQIAEAWNKFANSDYDSMTHPKHPDDSYSTDQYSIEVESPAPAATAATDALLRRAHDLMSGVHNSDTFADCSDLVDDIRLHLHLDVLDCHNCSAVVPAADAMNHPDYPTGEIWLCPDCARAWCELNIET